MTESNDSKSHEHEKKHNSEHVVSEKKHEHRLDKNKTHVKDKKLKFKKQKESNLDIWQITTIVLLVILVASFLTSGFGMWNNVSLDSDNKTINTNDNESISNSGAVKFKMYIVNDNRCTECQAQEQQLMANLKQMFPKATIEQVEYNSKKGKKFYDENKLKYLPALMFEKEVKKDKAYDQISQFVKEQNDKLLLVIRGITYNPEAEICSNGIDDNGNGDIDCADSDCKNSWECVEKKETPKVELFIMSYCPYGTQMEKGLLPVVELLKDKIDFELKFVNYAMHGEKEVKEELNQYCIQKEQKDKLLPYVRCFLEKGDGESCLKKSDIDVAMMKSCLDDTEKEFGVLADYSDKSTWKGRFPFFSIYNEDNLKYGVAGSPHLVINGMEPNAGRDSVSLLKAVCSTFKNKPEECNTVFESGSPSPGFGWSETQATANTATCG